MQVSPKAEGGEVDEPALTTYSTASCERLEELGYSVEERSAELEIMLMEDDSPCGGDVMVSPAAFLNLGRPVVPLNELTVVMDVRPVREQKVCCALVQHKAKEGSQWWKICGGAGAHSHQGLTFCGRHQQCHRTQATTGKVPICTADTAACSSEYGLGFFKCLSDSHVVCHSAIAGKSPGEAMASAFILAKRRAGAR
jgi:hypothetical protein